MPIDPNAFARSFQAQQGPGLTDILGKVAALRERQQVSAINDERLKGERMQNQATQLSLDSQTKLRQAFIESGGDYEKMYDIAAKSGVDPNTLVKLKDELIQQKTHLAGLDKAQREALQQKNAMVGQGLNAILSVPPEQQPQAYAQTRAQMIQNGIIGEQDAPAEFPGADFLRLHATASMATDKQLADARSAEEHAAKLPGVKADTEVKVAEAQAVQEVGPVDPKIIDARALFIRRKDPKLRTPAEQSYLTAYDAQVRAKKTSVSVNSGATATDAKDIAASIIRGEQPPTVTGLYRNAAPVRAELARAGFNLAQAESDWKAVQKHLATLNGAQQERLKQAVTFTYDSLDQIEGLYKEWKQLGPNSGFQIINSASLAAAKQAPGRLGEVATALEAQINDLTSELGTVYKGGNSSTDESLRLASGNLKAKWNDQTFARAIKLIRTNLGIRKNSIIHSQASGVSANSPYQQGGGSEVIIVSPEDLK